MENTNFSTAEVLGKLLAGAMLYEVDFDGAKGSEALQVFMNKAKKWIGDEDTKRLIQSTANERNAFVYLCIDKAVLGDPSTETTQLLKKLDETSRVFVELIFLRVTGQNLTTADDKPRQRRWAPTLWKLKTFSQRYLALSPSDVTDKDLARAIKSVIIPMMETLSTHTTKLLV